MPAAAAFASAPACRRRSAFSRSPSCTCAMSGVSPENGSLRSSAAAPVPVTRRRSKQSCVWTRLHKLTSALLLSPVYRHTCSMLDASAVTSPSPTRTHAAHAHHHLLLIISEGIFSQDLFAILMLAGGRNSKPASAANSAEGAKRVCALPRARAPPSICRRCRPATAAAAAVPTAAPALH